jgi:hypothetical protein
LFSSQRRRRRRRDGFLKNHTTDSKLKIGEQGISRPDESVLFVQDLLAKEAFCQEISPPNTARLPFTLVNVSKTALKNGIFGQKNKC